MTPILADTYSIPEGVFWLIVIFLWLAYTSDSWPFNKRGSR